VYFLYRRFAVRSISGRPEYYGRGLIFPLTLGPVLDICGAFDVFKGQSDVSFAKRAGTLNVARERGVH
jgi:hypothetical protein